MKFFKKGFAKITQEEYANRESNNSLLTKERFKTRTLLKEG